MEVIAFAQLMDSACRRAARVKADRPTIADAAAITTNTSKIQRRLRIDHSGWIGLGTDKIVLLGHLVGRGRLGAVRFFLAGFRFSSQAKNQ
jgi:hypothetical protein